MSGNASQMVNWKEVTWLTRKGFEEEYIDLCPQFGRIDTPYFMFLVLPSVGERQKCIKTHLLLVHEHDKGRRGSHRVLRSQLMSATHLDIDLDKSDKTGLHPPGFLLGGFFESRFDEMTRSTRGRGKEGDDCTV